MFGEKAVGDSTASFLRKPYTGGFTGPTGFPTRSSLDEEPEKLQDFTVTQHETGSREFGSSVFNDKPAETPVSATVINSSTPELKLPDISNPYLSSSDNTHSRSGLSNRLDGADKDTSSPVASSLYSRDERLKLSNDNLPDNHSGESSTASDFTSVSQREINPKYYKGAPQRAKLPGQYMPAPNAPPLPYSGQYYPQQAPPVLMPPPQHQPYYAPSYNPPKPKTRADILFNNNPDFAIGGGGPRRMAYKKFGGGPLQGMHPGMVGRDAIPQHMASGSYKNRPRPNFPAASLSKDSPYGRL